MADYLLSICIPTYNRCDALSKCIESIVNSEVFASNKIEIVVSDNYSNDNTPALMNNYCSKSENIHYFRNDSNIGGEANFIKVLNCATGKFRKLHNDYSVFTDSGLRILLNIVATHEKSEDLLIFTNGTCLTENRILENLDDFLRTVQWSSSWIGCYGFWESDWNEIDNKDRYAEKNFQQIDWFLRVFDNNKQCFIYNDILTNRVEFKSSQGGYNFLKVHIENFIGMYKPLVNQQKLSRKSISYVKRKMLPNMIGWYFIIRKNDKNKFHYDSNNGLVIIIRNYWYYWWFYFDIIKALIKKIF